MLLKDWIYKFHEKIYKGDLVWRTHAKGLHVVGDCDSCQFQEPKGLDGWECSRHPFISDQSDFGCKEWESKNG